MACQNILVWVAHASKSCFCESCATSAMRLRGSILVISNCSRSAIGGLLNDVRVADKMKQFGGYGPGALITAKLHGTKPSAGKPALHGKVDQLRGVPQRIWLDDLSAR